MLMADRFPSQRLDGRLMLKGSCNGKAPGDGAMKDVIIAGNLQEESFLSGHPHGDQTEELRYVLNICRHPVLLSSWEVKSSQASPPGFTQIPLGYEKVDARQ